MTAIGTHKQEFPNEAWLYAISGYGVATTGEIGNHWWKVKMKFGTNFQFIDTECIAATLFGDDPLKYYEMVEPIQFGQREEINIEISQLVGTGVAEIDLVFHTMAPATR